MLETILFKGENVSFKFTLENHGGSKNIFVMPPC